jgi:hypothetical protein
VIESLHTLGLEARTVPMGHLESDRQLILAVAKRQCSTSSFPNYLVAELFAEDRRAAFRLRSFVVTCRRLPIQAHIPFRLSILTLLMRTKTASMNPASTLSFTTSVSEMPEACRPLSRDPYISLFRVPSSWTPFPQSLSSYPGLFNRARKWTCLVC